jgi:hypothetical protein
VERSSRSALLGGGRMHLCPRTKICGSYFVTF